MLEVLLEASQRAETVCDRQLIVVVAIASQIGKFLGYLTKTNCCCQFEVILKAAQATSAPIVHAQVLNQSTWYAILTILDSNQFSQMLCLN